MLYGLLCCGGGGGGGGGSSGDGGVGEGLLTLGGQVGGLGRVLMSGVPPYRGCRGRKLQGLVGGVPLNGPRVVGKRVPRGL